MPDEKLVPPVGYDPTTKNLRKFRESNGKNTKASQLAIPIPDSVCHLDQESREMLSGSLGVPFSEDDFDDMERAISKVTAMFYALKWSPSPDALAKGFDRIKRAAQDLYTAIFPTDSELALAFEWATEQVAQLTQALKDDPGNKELRNRLRTAKKHLLAARDEFGSAKLCIDILYRSEFMSQEDICALNDFRGLLTRLPIVVDVASASPPPETVSERGTGHLRFLLKEMQKIAKRHGKSTKYTHSVHERFSDESFVAELAHQLCWHLPEEGKPESVDGLIAMLARMPSSDAK